uniref:Sperm flagellar 1 n=1 Tax=Neolamprologus brichardi TaxID=32507 RepID=A0A3Q4H3V2_NEOBR
MERELNEEELQDLFAWIDKIPLSRPKRHITRDFSDAVMAAEVVKYFFPKLVDLHNYVSANSTQQKLSNWNLLNRKVFSKLDFHVPEETLKKIAQSTTGAIVPVLSTLREKIDKKLEYTTNNILVCSDTHGIGHFFVYLNAKYELLKVERAVKFYSDMDPAFQQMLKEKEKAIMSLMETVEILQMKVNKLEHLVHLKDVRIQDLTQHLETYKARGNTH